MISNRLLKISIDQCEDEWNSEMTKASDRVSEVQNKDEAEMICFELTR